MRPPTRRADQRPFRISHSALRLLLVGGAVELALVLGLVWPLWLFGQRNAVTTDEPLATLLGTNASGLLRFAATLTIWLGGYGFALRESRRPLTVGARRTLALLPLLFAVTLMLTLPASSKDVYHYVLEGRILAVYGDNPLVVPPAAYPNDPLAWVIDTWQETPSRYGPAFGLVAGAVAAIGRGNLTVMLLSFKLVAVLALLGTAILSAATARCIRPGLAWPGYVLVAWNPLALYEAGANAHNDLLMVLCTALTLFLAVRGRLDLALPALALGVLVKYVVAVLAPLLLLDALRTGRWRQVVIGGGCALFLAVALYLPFWEGARTFDALRGAAGDMTSSPGWMLRQGLKHWLGWEGARPVVISIMTGAFLAGYTVLLAHWWKSYGGRDYAAFALAVLALVLCTLSWWLWPWYMLWLLPAGALLADRRAGLLTVVITGAALAAYLPINFRPLFWGPTPTDHMPFFAFLTMFIPPLLFAGGLRFVPGRETNRG